MRTAVVVAVGLAALAGTATAGTATAGTATAGTATAGTDGTRSFRDGGGTLTVTWRATCGVTIAPGAYQGTWHPTLDLKVAESGQTGWVKVKLAYKYRTHDETFIVQTLTSDLRAANSVVDPARYGYDDAPRQVGSNDKIDRSGDSFGVGFRLAVSRDGTHWSTLTQPALTECAPASA